MIKQPYRKLLMAGTYGLLIGVGTQIAVKYLAPVFPDHIFSIWVFFLTTLLVFSNYISWKYHLACDCKDIPKMHGLQTSKVGVLTNLLIGYIAAICIILLFKLLGINPFKHLLT